jgi:predicted esterase
VAHRQIRASRLLLYAGKVPEELGPDDFAHLPPDTTVEILYGNRDPYLEKWDRRKMEQQAQSFFGDRLRWRPYEGGHELLTETISD